MILCINSPEQFSLYPKRLCLEERYTTPAGRQNAEGSQSIPRPPNSAARVSQ
jgi:hypothetical protein